MNLYTMKLGEVTKCAYWEVSRVPGGWIFHAGNGSSQTAVFVPWNNEFEVI